jgi:plasmid maintenance system antidote protein VapI
MTEASEIEVLQAQVQVAEELINWHVRSMAIIHEAMGSPYRGDGSKNARDVARLAAERLRAAAARGVERLRIPAEPTHPADIIQDEMKERGWDLNAMVDAMEIADERDRNIARLAFEGYFTVRAANIILGERMAEMLGIAFGAPSQFWLDLHEQWRAAALAVTK